jgi:zinc-binding alcohol dehydrogenase/oxidoreductase
MKALVLESLHQPLIYTRRPDPEPGPGEAVVALRAAALNHRDVFITQGKYPGIKFPVILGSDGAGEYRGRPVVIDPSLEWGDSAVFQSRQFNILGLPTDGTFAEQVKVPRRNLHPKPEHLSWEAAAALPLAGVTAYRILFTRCRLRPGERVLITGIGGGVALMALQMAVAAGAEVYVTSGSEGKIGRAVELGAKGGADYRREGWERSLREAARGFDVVIDSAGGDGFALLPGLCNPGARIGVYGGTLGPVNGLSPQVIYWKQLNILGSTMGDRRDFRRMLAFVTEHRLVPVVDTVFALEDGNQALERMAKGEQFGKLVLRVRGEA